MRRLSATGEVGLGKELTLDVPDGLWVLFFQPIVPGLAVAPEIRLVVNSPGGGAASSRRSLLPTAGAVSSLPGPGRATLTDLGAQSPYTCAISAVPWHPPRWGLQPMRMSLGGGQSLTVGPPVFAVRGRIALVSGSLLLPPLTSGSLEIPAMDVTIQAGSPGADVVVDWEGWL